MSCCDDAVRWWWQVEWRRQFFVGFVASPVRHVGGESGSSPLLFTIVGGEGNSIKRYLLIDEKVQRVYHGTGEDVVCVRVESLVVC